MKRLPFFPFAIFLLFHLSGMAQISQPDRVELANLSEAVNFFVIPVGKNGALTFYKDRQSKGEKEELWIFKKLNTDFKEEWTKNLSIENSKDYVGNTFNNGKLYVLFQDYKNGEYQMMIADAIGNELNLVTYDALERFSITEFVVSNNKLFATGSYKRAPILVSIDLATKQSKLYNLEDYGKKVSIEDLQVDENTSEVILCLEAYEKKVRKFIVKSISPENDASSDFTVMSLSEEKWLLSASVKKRDDGSKLIAGVYSNKKRGGSQGIYLAKYLNGTQVFLRYYSFTEFSNFFEYLTERQQKRVERAIDKKEKDGKELNLNYRLLVHDIIEQDGQFIFIAEAYYPEYHTETRTEMRMQSYTTYVNGKPMTSMRSVPVTVSRQVFDGFRFTHAVVAGFSPEGSKLWDNCFEIWDVLTRLLKPQVKVKIMDNKVGMVYLLGNQLVSKNIEGNKVVEEKSRTLYETGQEGDRLRYTIGSIESWYDNYFLAWGFQKIKNDTEKESKRKVYFANKIKY